MQNDRELLLTSIKGENLEKVREILINEPGLIDAEGLFAAALTGNPELVKWLVEYSRISLNEYDRDHRNVLHYAAQAGDPDTFIYLTEKCGMDPLSGDKNLVTPWDLVHNGNILEPDNATNNKNLSSSSGKVSHMDGYPEKDSHYTCDTIENADKQKDGFRDIEKYLEKKYGHKYEDFYRNPIRTGFFPDPSIVRVGSDYYMVNSSFIFFPCIPISHSKDLVHWEIIGHAITEPSWAHLDELEGGRGYWAPDISYYEGKFYITATYRLNDVPPTYRRQIVVSSDKPEGPYSEPVFIDEDGIDPSIFNDDDGRRYMLLNRGARIFELDSTATRKISDAALLYYGYHKRAPEGPHLYKKDGYYYLLEAEGGTGPGHRVTVSRSKELFGTYEPCPYNPIMRQEDEGAALQRCGHGDLVDTPDGRWYMVYLCGRMTGDGYSILGRETALDPVTWTADGWPIVNSLKGPSAMQVMPYSASESSFEKNCDSDEDRLSPCGLFMDYMTPRPFEEGGVICRPGRFRTFEITGSRAPLDSTLSRNIVLRRQTAFRFRYEVTLELPKLCEGQSAGITGYYDENTFFEFGITARSGRIYVYSREHIGDEDRFKLSDSQLESSEIRLRMDTDYLRRDLYFRSCGEDDADRAPGDEAPAKELIETSDYTLFTTLDNVNYLCDEGLKKGKRFTGALVGMYVCRGEGSLKAIFHHDSYTVR